MKHLLGAGLFGAALAAQPAIAADMPVRKSPLPQVTTAAVARDWSGFYAGGHLGYGFSKFDAVYDFLPFELKPDSWLGGVQAGYNWQSGQYVYGVEIDGTWSRLRDDRVDPGLDKQRIDTSLLASARLRGGFTMQNVLLFSTVGIAYGKTKFTAIGDTLSPASRKLDSWGPVAGVGIDWAFAPNWSMRAEYLHYWLDKRRSLAGLTGEAETNDFARMRNAQVVRVAINFEW